MTNCRQAAAMTRKDGAASAASVAAGAALVPGTATLFPGTAGLISASAGRRAKADRSYKEVRRAIQKNAKKKEVDGEVHVEET